jgi:hypothetical protein
MSVLFVPKVQEYLYELEDILYEKGYYSFEESAIKYVDDLINDIKTNLPSKQHKPAPKHYEQYGRELYYATFKKNRQTSWYAFFSKYIENEETVYLVCYIGNTHTDAHHLL